jgi:Phage tail tube protein
MSTFAIGASGALGIALESTMGTYVAPTVWVPILEESLVYTEDKYYSQQLRQQATDSDVKPSYYHTEGDVRMEVDMNFLPYFFMCSRHAITKTGAGPYTYKFTPTAVGGTSTAASGMVQRTASITIIRNQGTASFGYTGCTLGGYEFTIDNGVLLVNMSIIGLGEEDGSGTPAWIAPSLFGADAHTIFVDTAGTAPAFATPVNDFNGYTFTANHNAEAQNRIRPQRSASYVKFGKTDFELTSELDFVAKSEYTNFKNASVKAFRMESLKGGVSFAAATEAIRLDQNRVAYDAYGVSLPGIGDIVMAQFTGHGLNIVGGDAYSVTMKSPVNIA